MCKEAVASNPASVDRIAEEAGVGYQWVDGFKWGILSLMSAPFLLVGFGGWFIARNLKRERATRVAHDESVPTSK